MWQSQQCIYSLIAILSQYYRGVMILRTDLVHIIIATLQLDSFCIYYCSFLRCVTTMMLNTLSWFQVYDNGLLAYRSMEKTYDKDGPDSVEVEVSENLQKDLSYTAQINVSTAVSWATTQFQFGKLKDLCICWCYWFQTRTLMTIIQTLLLMDLKLVE